MSLTAKDVAEIVRLLDQSSFDELNLEVGDLKLRLKRGESASEVLVREVMPLRRVSVKQLFTQRSRSRHVDVELELSARDGGIQVTQTLNHRNAVGFVVNLLIWFIHRFGKPVGIPPLERLKSLAECH